MCIKAWLLHLLFCELTEDEVAMIRPTRVAVKGYGVIGKRVTDAVRAQKDRTLVGGADVATDWRTRGRCQFNANLSPPGTTRAGSSSSGGERVPFGKGGRASGFEIVSADEVAVLVEVVVEGGMDGAELLQRLHLPEAEHGPFSSSKRQM